MLVVFAVWRGVAFAHAYWLQLGSFPFQGEWSYWRDWIIVVEVGFRGLVFLL